MKKIEQPAYTPEFTARVVGAEPLKVTQKQAQQLLKQAMTGFEIRPSVIISGKEKRIPLEKQMGMFFSKERVKQKVLGKRGAVKRIKAKKMKKAKKIKTPKSQNMERVLSKMLGGL
jgi:hypothetical protein